MTVAEIRKIASGRGITTIPKKKADIVRCIQQDEGNSSCFGSGASGVCGQDGCAWRADCLKADK